MKGSKIHLIRANYIPEEKEEEDLTPKDLSLLNDLCDCFDNSDEWNFHLTKVGNLYYLFLKVEDYQVRNICKVFDDYTEYQIEDITYLIFMGDESFYGIIEKEPLFFEEFRKEYTSIDDVLDKISLKGINSLDYIDRKILESK